MDKVKFTQVADTPQIKHAKKSQELQSGVRHLNPFCHHPLHQTHLLLLFYLLKTRFNPDFKSWSGVCYTITIFFTLNMYVCFKHNNTSIIGIGAYNVDDYSMLSLFFPSWLTKQTLSRSFTSTPWPKMSQSSNRPRLTQNSSVRYDVSSKHLLLLVCYQFCSKSWLSEQ